MKVKWSLLLLTCVIAALHPALAAEAPATASTPAEATAATVTTDDAAAPADSTEAEDPTPGTMAADDTFVPTVEISEDLSVSFPADI